MRASERAYQDLRADIIEWHLEPGAVLSEVELAERFGVSRTPVREAISRLLSEGLAAPKAGRGVVVSGVSEKTVREMFELRTALDTQAAALAAIKGEPQVFADLAHHLETAAIRLEYDDADRHAYYELVSRMDAAIDEAAANDYLLQAQRQLRSHLGRVRKLSKGNDERLRQAADEHASIARTIADRDVELAKAATRLHLARSLEAILTAIRGADPEPPREDAANPTAWAMAPAAPLTDPVSMSAGKDPS